MSMSIKRSKRSSRGKRSHGKSRASSPLRRQAAMVKKLAAHYRKIGKKVDIGKLGKEAAAINRGDKKFPSSRSHSKSHSKRTKKTKRTKRTKRRTSRR